MGVKKRVQKKSFIKKEVEEIVPASTKFLNFFFRYAKESLTMLTIFILICAFFFLWNIYSSNQEKKARELFTEAYKYYSRAIDRGNSSDYQLASVKLNDLVNKFPRTAVGEKSLFYLGNCYYWVRDYNNAEKYFRLFIDKSSKKEKLLRKYSYESLGYAAEERSKFDKAIEYFKKAAEESDSTNLDDYGLMNLARVYEEMKKNDKAIEIYQKIIKDYPQTDYMGIAKSKLFTLKTHSTN